MGVKQTHDGVLGRPIYFMVKVICARQWKRVRSLRGSCADWEIMEEKKDTAQPGPSR